MKKATQKTISLDDLAGMIKMGFDGVDNRFKGIDTRLDGIDHRLDKIEMKDLFAFK